MSNHTKPSVLVVDDEEEIRSVISAILQSDFDTVEARDGRQALEVLKNRSIDVVLTDYNMPQMGGIELLKSLRASDETMPIIVLTGRGSREMRMKNAGLQVIEYMEKPFQAEELLQKVKSALSFKNGQAAA